MNESESADRVEALFHQVVDVPVAERAAFLERVCGDHVSLRTQIERLLEAEAQGGAFLTDPTLEPAPFAEEPDALIGLEVGPYKVLQLLGEGGYGVVYLAEQRQPVTRRVALKVIKLGMDTKQVIARFEAERQALAMMEHPNIAKVLDAGATESGRPYFVMELVRGVPLTDYCDQNQLPTEQRLKLFIDVCRAVQHAHQKGVIHRDLKPSNILVTLHDGVPVPKVIDFGIAKATNVRLTEKTLFTEFHQFLGTPAYTSPEQVEMSGLDIDTRSDIYSLGVLLYELLTGTTPIDTDTLKQAAYVEIQRTILEWEPPKPSTRATEIKKRALTNTLLQHTKGQIAQDLDWIAMKALEKDRERRYGSAQALAQDVESFLRQEPILAAAPSATYRLRKFASRHHRVLLTAVALLGLLIAGSTVSVWQAIKATSASQRERKAKLEAQDQTRQARASALEARRNLYVANMNVAQSALQDGNVESVVSLLDNHRPQNDEEDLRHFEWRYLWNQTHRERFTLLADDDPSDAVKPDPLYDVSLAPSGNTLASISRRGRVRVWDLTSREELFQFEREGQTASWSWVEFSPDGRYLAAASIGLPEVVLWDVTQRLEVKRFIAVDAESAIDPRFSHDGGTLMAGDNLGNVWFWNVDTGVGQAIKGHNKSVSTVAIAADASRLVTMAERDGITLWDVAQRKILLEVKNADHPEWRTNWLSGANLSPDGKRVAVSTRIIALTSILDTENGETLAELWGGNESHGMRFSPNGKSLAVTEFNGALHLYETETWQRTTTFQHPGHQLNAITYSADGQLLVSVGDAGKIVVWPGLPEPSLGILQAGDVWAVNRVTFLPHTNRIGTENFNGSFQLWESDAEALLFATPERTTWRGWRQSPYQLPFTAIHPDGHLLALVVHGHAEDPNSPRVEFWDLEKEEMMRVLPLRSTVRQLCYSPNGQYIALAGGGQGANHVEGNMRLLESETLVEKMVLPVDGAILSLAFSRDGKLLATIGATVQIWDLQTQQLVATLTEHIQPVGNSSVVAFSPDGTLLASAGYDSRVLLWDTATWRIRHRLQGHQGRLVGLSFSPDGKRLVSSGIIDNRCTLWDVVTGQPLAKFTGVTADFSPDGQTLAIGGYAPYQSPDIFPAETTSVRLYRAH